MADSQRGRTKTFISIWGLYMITEFRQVNPDNVAFNNFDETIKSISINMGEWCFVIKYPCRKVYRDSFKISAQIKLFGGF